MQKQQIYITGLTNKGKQLKGKDEFVCNSDADAGRRDLYIYECSGERLRR